ncbi:Putative 8-oxo-dGTP diphosphatase 3 [Halioglobus japonicus]|nr:Putative 8-oxo-dGTP diphosphatase 3 [Halioglobus japonicus]
MLETSDIVEPVYPAATVVLVRDGDAGLEALLVQRNKTVQHMGGMWVFPGGKVDEADYPGDRDEYRAAVNAAIRETQEEAGLKVSAEQLVYLSHWTTPEGAKRRFSTWFFLTILEDGQEVVVDGGEIARHRWVSPETALAECADDTHALRLMPPTYVSLADIADCKSCVEARERMGDREAVMYEPRMVGVDDGICFLYEGDAGYDDVVVDAEGERHRLYMIDNRLEYIRRN